MRTLRCLRVVCAMLLILATTHVPLRAWGVEAHYDVTGRAIDLLPSTIKPFFDAHRTFIVAHSIDPDLWRLAGFEDEPPRHFVDLDAYGPPPFTALPRDFDAAVAARGRDFVIKNGTLPWRTQEIYDKLVKAFGDAAAGRPYALENVKFFSAVLAHYVGDAHVPFHAVLNYDGQLSGQHGIHARFESELFAKTRGRLQVTPAPVKAIPGSARDYIFDTLAESFDHVPGILAADLSAIGAGTLYDEGYFTRFEPTVRPVMEKRLGAASTSIASLIVKAWDEAGRPALPLTQPSTVRSKRLPPA